MIPPSLSLDLLLFQNGSRFSSPISISVSTVDSSSPFMKSVLRAVRTAVWGHRVWRQLTDMWWIRWELNLRAHSTLSQWPTVPGYSIHSGSWLLVRGTRSKYFKLLSPLSESCRKPSEYIAAILELSALVAKRHQRPLMFVDLLYYLTRDGMRFRKACNLVHEFTDAVIQKRRHTLPSQGLDDFLKSKAESKTLDFIDVLLLVKVGFSRSRMDIDAKCLVK